MKQPPEFQKISNYFQFFLPSEKQGQIHHLAAFANYWATSSHKVARLARELAEGAKELASFTGLLAAWEKRLAGLAGESA